MRRNTPFCTVVWSPKGAPLRTPVSHLVMEYVDADGLEFLMGADIHSLVFGSIRLGPNIFIHVNTAATAALSCLNIM